MAEGYHKYSKEMLEEKDTLITKLREQGLTIRQIGMQVGMTEHSVKQRLWKMRREAR